MPVDVRSLSLIVLAVLASHLRAALGEGAPRADPARRDVQLRADAGRRPPGSAGACRARSAPASSLAAVVAVIGWGGWALADDATALIETLPQRRAEGARRDWKARAARAAGSPIDKVQQAADELEKAADQAASEAASAARGRIGCRRRRPRARGHANAGTPARADAAPADAAATTPPRA